MALRLRPETQWEYLDGSAGPYVYGPRGRGLPCSIVTRDYDGTFSKAFDQVFKERSIQVKRVGPQAPNLNAFIERWIQSLEQEALDHFIVLGKEHIDHLVSKCVAYYHEPRPHQGLGNVLLPRATCQPDVAGDDDFMSPLRYLAEVKCEQRLGGLLKHYYRASA